MQGNVLRIPAQVKHICQTLTSSGYEAYVVGGAVRDHFLGNHVKDWDIATSALPGDVQRILPRVIATGIKHGTVTVLLDGGSYEVTTYRGDGAYTDGRRPDEVRFGVSL